MEEGGWRWGMVFSRCLVSKSVFFFFCFKWCIRSFVLKLRVVILLSFFKGYWLFYICCYSLVTFDVFFVLLWGLFKYVGLILFEIVVYGRLVVWEVEMIMRVRDFENFFYGIFYKF